jgi:hypothetical protein
MHDQESPEQKAVRLLKRQLDELQTIRGLNYEHAEFKAWRDSTRIILDRYLGPQSHHTQRFGDTRFSGPPVIRTNFMRGPRTLEDYISPEEVRAFEKACETSEATLRAAIRHIEDFGVHVEEVKPAGRGRSKSGSVSQNFHGPVSIHNLAIAADNAVQKIGHMGNEAGASLKEIAELLQQSEELSPRQVKEGLAHIEAVAVEVAKPEAKRDWKGVLASGQAILDLTNKATDLALKIAPHTPAIIALVEQAKHCIR